MKDNQLGGNGLQKYFAEQAAISGQALSEQVADMLAHLFKQTVYPRGSHVVLPGQRLDANVLFVYSGLLRIYTIQDDGKELNKGFILPGSLAGSLIAGEADWPMPYGIQALEDSRVYTANPERVSELIGQHPALQSLFRSLQSQLAAYKARRAAALQSLSAAERYEYFVREEQPLARKLPAYHVASYLGMSEVTLSRLRNNTPGVS